MRVIVVGAGVVGLSCAVRLLEQGHRVDVVARDLPLETTSVVAAALVRPYRVGPPDLVERWTAASVAVFTELALAQEKRVTEQINGLLRTARDEYDFASEQFMQWFIKEQVEEVATMSDLLAVVRRNADDIDDIEDYVAREQTGEGADATAPRIAGA